MECRFGISRKRFADYLVFRKRHSWFLFRNTRLLTSAAQLKVTQVGLKAFQQVAGFVKPTTRFIQSFGRFATRAKLQINNDSLQALLRGEKIPVDMTLDNGYVILAMGEDNILGLGLYINGMVSSQLPKKEIRSAMLT
jgi:hypothetical protein